MKVAKSKVSDDKIEFTLEGASTQTANALRRAVIAEVPVMAIEEVTFLENRSVLDDEIFAHRLGLIPLTTDLKTYVPIEECTCKGEGCAKCTANLTLEAAGPATVYAGELDCKDPKIKAAHPKMLLTQLGEHHKVKLEAKAMLGRGSEHIKWQAGLASYDAKKDGSFDFTIESHGQYKPKELLTNAINEVEARLKEVKKEVK